MWKPIKDYEKNYAINNLGEIKNIKRNKLLKLEKKREGYLCVNLWKNNKQKTFNVHRLVAIHFIPNKLNKPCVHHKNGVKSDNRVENLEWITYKENSKNAFENNFINCSKNAKLTYNEVLEIRKMKKLGFSNQKLASDFNTTTQNISKIVNYQTWKYMPLAQEIKG